MKFRRSTYLINPKFQLKVGFFLSSLIFILSLAYPITIFSLFESLVKQSGLRETYDLFLDNKWQLFITLAVFHIGFIGVIFVITIIQAHKIAGPLYKLKNYFLSFSNGIPSENISFRKDDHFQDVAESVNVGINSLKNSYNKDYIYLSEISDYLKNIHHVLPEDKKIVVEAMLERLDEIQEKFRPV